MHAQIYHGLVFILTLLLVGQCAFGQSSSSTTEDRLEKEILSEYSKGWEYPTAEEDLIENLLLSSLSHSAIPDPLECTELDPQKYFDVMNIERKILRMCDLCPNLPFQKLANVNFDQNPTFTKDNSTFQDCLAICLSMASCMTVSFGSGKCHIFDNTEGNLVKINGQQLIIITQPTGIIRDWVYSRNTGAKFGSNVNVSEPGYFENGPQIMTSIQDSFTDCLQQCDVNMYCISVSYKISTKNCEVLLNIDSPEPDLAVDYKYGHLAALKINRFASVRNNSWWRFQNPLGADGKPTELFKEHFVYETNKTADVKNDFGEIESLECSIRNASFCSSNNTIRCRNPENSGDKEQFLPICPGSRYTKYNEIKTRMDALEQCFDTCLNETLCVGVTFSPSQLACEAVTINDDSIFKPPEMFFPLRIPSSSLNNTAVKYSIYPGFSINETGISSTSAPNASTCLDMCRKSLLCPRFSYDRSSKECKLADKLTSLVANPNSLMFIEVPAISSPKIRFTRLVSTELVGRESLKYLYSSDKLSKEMMELYVDTCLVECLDYFENRCQSVRVQYDFKNGRTTCILYQNGGMFPFDDDATSVEVYIRNSQGKFTSFAQEDLDQVSFFGPGDFMSCFRSKSPLSFNNLQGINSEAGTFLEPAENVSTRLAYARTSYVRTIPKELSDRQRSLKDTLFETLGEQLLDVADELVPMNKINNTIGRRSSVVKIWQSSNLENIFQEIGLLPYDRKPSPFRVIRGSSKPPGSGELSSFGAGQSGLMLVLEKLQRNETEFSSLAAQSIYGHTGHLREFTHSIRFQFSSFERLEQPTDTFIFAVEKKTKKTTCKRGDKCPVSKKIRNLDAYKKRAICTRNFMEDVDTFCSTEECPGTTVSTVTGEFYQHKFPISGYLEPFSRIGSIEREVNWYIVIFDRLLESDDSQNLTQYTAHVLDDMNYGPIRTARGSSKWWKRHACATSSEPGSTLTKYQFDKVDYMNSKKVNHDRGHFVPDRDMSCLGYDAVRSTYLFVNAAPQFASLNRGLWSSYVEDSIRKRVEQTGAIVVTGISPHTFQEPIASPSYGFTALVPKYFWKLVCFKEKDGTVVTFGYTQKNWVKMINDEIKEPFVVTRKPTEVIQVSYAITAEIAEKKLKEIWESVITNDLTKNRKPRGSFPTAGECLTAGRSPMSVASDTKCDWQIKNERLTSPMDLVDCKDMREEFARMAPFDSQIANDSELDTEPDDSEYPPEESVTINWHYKTLADDGYFNSTVCNKRLVGYFNGKNPNYAFTHVTGLALTHAIYLTLPFQKDGSIDLEQLKSEDNSGSFAEFLLKVKTFDHVISMVSIGENNEDSSRNFSSLASDPVKRIKFIDSVATIIRIFDLRGVDINWQHFYLPEMENNDKENYITLLKELRQVFNEIEKKDEDERKLSISIVGPADASEIDSGLDLPQLLKYADWVNVNLLVEDEKVLPLYPANVSQTNPGRNNADWVLRYYTCKAKEFGPYKINMAVAFQESHSNQSLLSLRERASYTADKNLGGFSVFGIDKFKSRNYTQLEIIRDTNLCKVDINERKFKCYDSGIQRWLPIGKEAPKCGASAPKVNGFPAVCNPYDPDFGCCGGTGICGSGSGFCNCSSCVDYYNFPEKIV